MGILTNIVAAEEDEVASVGESSHPVDQWSGLERRDIDTAKIATLHCLLTNDQFSDALSAYEPVYVSSEGAVVLHVANEVMEKLATLDEDALHQVAEELAATEEYERENWETEDILTLVLELAGLAQLADSQEQVLLVWMHPLLT